MLRAQDAGFNSLCHWTRVNKRLKTTHNCRVCRRAKKLWRALSQKWRAIRSKVRYATIQYKLIPHSGNVIILRCARGWRVESARTTYNHRGREQLSLQAATLVKGINIILGASLNGSEGGGRNGINNSRLSRAINYHANKAITLHQRCEIYWQSCAPTRSCPVAATRERDCISFCVAGRKKRREEKERLIRVGATDFRARETQFRRHRRKVAPFARSLAHTQL